MGPALYLYANVTRRRAYGQSGDAAGAPCPKWEGRQTRRVRQHVRDYKRKTEDLKIKKITLEYP